jgi:N-acetylneuraminic acid mutarotase
LHVTGAPAITTTFQNSDVVAYIQAVIAAGGPQPNGNTLYLLYLPEQGALASSFGGYHSPFPSDSTTQGDSFAAVQWGGVYPPMTQFDLLTTTASHEVLEASTDPAHNGLCVGPSSAEPWTTSVWASLQSGHIETGDLCEGTITEESYEDAGLYYQRIFSNPIAEDGGDNPCVPQEPGPYYGVSIPEDWYQASPGDTLQIPFTGWSSAPTASWLLFPLANEASPDLDAGVPEPSVVSDLGQGAGATCEPREACNNGTTGTLTVQMPAQAVPGDWGVFGLDSFVEGYGQGGCEQPLSGDQHHRWLVGIYVPFVDAGLSGPAALPPSPISCAYLAAAFGSDGDLYQICGYEPAYGNLGQMERYSPTSQSWSAAPTPPPGPQANLAAVTGPDGRVYVIDGWDGVTRWAKLEAFDPQTQTWQLLPPPQLQRDDLAAVTGPDGRLYVIGGWDGTEALDTVEVYDLDAGWSDLSANLPIAVRGAGAAVGSDGKIYVMGGETIAATDAGLVFTPQEAVQVYDLQSNSWSTGPSLPEAWSFGAAVADSSGAIYLVGGVADGYIVEQTLVYLPASGWATANALPELRGQLAGALGPDGDIYVVGGYLGGENDLPTGALSAYSQSCACWTQ